jgi:hypothetical protein
MVLESDGYGTALFMKQVLESNGHGVREGRLWCQRVTVMVLESNGYGTALFMKQVLESNGHGVRE